MNKTWQALAREAGIAAEHLAIGVSAIGKANYAQHAYYYQAFFALTIGLERAVKLAITVDHALEHNGKFPSDDMIRKHGHDLRKLLDLADDIAGRRGFKKREDRLPRTKIHDNIIHVLSDFANNITRYYNLEFVSGSVSSKKRNDPIHEWFDLVISPVLTVHYRSHYKVKHQAKAKLISDLIGNHTLVLHESERGGVLNNVFDASMQTALTEFAKPYVRMYVMQIIRFLSSLFWSLTNAVYSSRLDTIPVLSEFFAIFNNSDKYFKQRKTWSIYRP